MSLGHHSKVTQIFSEVWLLTKQNLTLGMEMHIEQTLLNLVACLFSRVTWRRLWPSTTTNFRKPGWRSANRAAFSFCATSTTGPKVSSLVGTICLFLGRLPHTWLRQRHGCMLVMIIGMLDARNPVNWVGFDCLDARGKQKLLGACYWSNCSTSFGKSTVETV